MACAWAAFCCYGLMMLLSYLVGRKKHPIGYDIPRIIFYFAVALTLWAVSAPLTTGNNLIDFPTRTLLLCVYVGVVWLAEFRRKPAHR